MKSLPARAAGVALPLVWASLLVVTSPVSAQTNYYAASGTEYPVVGALPGDQVFPDVAISTTNGIVVWQDNATDGDGWGISARRLDGTLSGKLSTFRINATGAGDQENPKVALLKNSGAAIVWQGGVEGFQHIFARFLTPTNTFLTSTDMAVSTFTSSNSFQVNPALAVLNNSNIVVVWSSFNQAGSNTLFDVYGKILSPAGATVKAEFLVNQFTNYNQRSPVVTALSGGGFAVAWVSEMERAGFSTVNETNGTATTAIAVPSVDIYARLFQSNGVAVGNEFLVNTALAPCANPSIAAGGDGGFMIGWSGRDLNVITNSWDVYARSFTSVGVGGSVFRLNSYLYGSQYAPHLVAIGLDYLAVWTSMGQDGSREGVYGQFVRNTGAFIGGEFRVNTSVMSQQMQPAVASDGTAQFLAVWTSFVGSPYNMDLYAQRYLNAAAVLQSMSAPFVYAPFTLNNGVYQPQLQVTWAPVQGISITNYEIYVDGNSVPVGIVTSNQWTMTAANGLTTNSTHSFQVTYVTTDGRRPALSPSASGTTWSGLSWGGIPYEWMAAYYGGYVNGKYYTTYWPQPTAVIGAGGVTLSKIFVSGGNPLDPSTWLQQSLTASSEGIFLSWNTTPGATYQVQFTTNFSTWNNFGTPRFAAGTNDSINVGGKSVGYYRVTLLR